MGEEFQGGVCGGSWWNSSRNLFGPSPCSSAINDIGWLPNHDLLMDMNTTVSNSDSAGSNSENSSSVVLQDVAKPQQPFDVNDQNMPSFDWNQDLLLESGRSEENYSHLLQDSSAHVLNPSMNYRPQIKDWSSNNFCDNNSFKQVNQDFPIEQFTPITTQGQSSGFPLSSAPFSYTSLPLLQSLFEDDSLQGMNYSSGPSYRMINSNDFTKSIRPSMAKQQPANPLQFSNNTPYWNSKSPALNNVRPSFTPSTQSQFVPSSINNGKPNLPNFAAKHHNDEAGSVASVAKKASSETPFKRPRIETPSPLPTFKVRKEKLGDRITALQQLVSPFGKTDTASVLHEAIEYIRFLHDQVNVLSTPYMKNGSPPLQHQQAMDNFKDQEGQKQDLKSRGLCLVPISSTFPVASETTSDFWTPTFGGSFR